MPPSPKYTIVMDASGSWGCGAVFGSHWMQLAWSKKWAQMNTMGKEVCMCLTADKYTFVTGSAKRGLIAFPIACA